MINEQRSDDELKEVASPGSTGTGSWTQKGMSAEQVALNPEVDYTK